MGVETSSISFPKYDDLEVIISGQTSIPACASSSSQSSPPITHNLGFVPVIIAFVNIGGISNFNSQLPCLLYALGATITPKMVCDVNTLGPNTLSFYMACSSAYQTNAPSVVNYLICRRKTSGS